MRAEAFQKVTLFLEEHDEEQVTITDLIKQMNEFLDGSNLEPYGFTHMKEKLLDHFGDKIVVTEINGTQNVVTLRHTASAILRDFYQQPKDIDPETEKLRLIKAAANLVKSDIKSVIQPKDVYPTSLAMSAIPEATNFLPQSLRLLLNCLLVGKDKDLKWCALGQASHYASYATQNSHCSLAVRSWCTNAFTFCVQIPN